MENVLVSARVSQAKKEASRQVLASIGATTSDLINSALDYVIAQHELPRVDEVAPREWEEFEQFLAESTLDVPWGPETEDGDYRTMLEEGRRRDYESLA